MPLRYSGPPRTRTTIRNPRYQLRRSGRPWSWVGLPPRLVALGLALSIFLLAWHERFSVVSIRRLMSVFAPLLTFKIAAEAPLSSPAMCLHLRCTL